jgi:hypothetical protein
VLEEAAVVTETETEARVSTDDEQFLHRRDELIEPVITNLTRRVKRLLQDEQNLLLDRLRTHRGPIKADPLLPDPAAHLVPYVDAAMTALGDAEAAGAQLAGTGSERAPDRAELGALASTLAADLTEPLRRRLQEVLDRAEDVSAVADSINATYRETKSRRIDRVIGDHVTAAMTLGMRRALPDGSPVHWLVDDADGPCPDCDDNALAGPTPLGDTFPTGQTGPPAHPGCRCLLRPASA